GPGFPSPPVPGTPKVLLYLQLPSTSPAAPESLRSDPRSFSTHTQGAILNPCPSFLPPPLPPASLVPEISPSPPTDPAVLRGPALSLPLGTLLTEVLAGTVLAEGRRQTQEKQEEEAAQERQEGGELACHYGAARDLEQNPLNTQENPVPLVLPLCLLPPERGNCDSLNLRYFYNSTSRLCEAFIYSGCNGNGNNFDTVECCLKTCRPNCK
uniref:BPTI/Kunitz inhibitor domain-containing protein n=1 Tax=Monodelphis domestica TaxID=13616 RepID=A0A5F8G2V9_MONDO